MIFVDFPGAIALIHGSKFDFSEELPARVFRSKKYRCNFFEFQLVTTLVSLFEF